MKKLDNGIMSFPPRGSERRCVIAQIKPPRFLHFQKEMRVGLVCRMISGFCEWLSGLKESKHKVSRYDSSPLSERFIVHQAKNVSWIS